MNKLIFITCLILASLSAPAIADMDRVSQTGQPPEKPIETSEK